MPSPLHDPAGFGRAEALDELSDLLRPPGQGIFSFSHGHRETLEATAAYLPGWSSGPWRDHLARLLTREAGGSAILAIPSDTGAGLVRGAAHGPRGIRAALRSAPGRDLGDALCVQHLLDEGSIHPEARARIQDAVHAHRDEPTRRRRPVSPLGIASRAVKLIHALTPRTRLCVLGGDHSVTWPVLDAILSPTPQQNEDVGIVHFDAHTDLLPDRQGIPYCFATWAWHANERIGRGSRLVQLGVRVSGRERDHWERELDVAQRWGDTGLEPAPLGAWVVEHLRARGVRRVYVSNDIDGTDERWASACGTPAPGGLTPDHVLGVLDALAAAPDLAPLGADVVEVAPVLGPPEAAKHTCALAARYVRATLAWLDAQPPPPFSSNALE